MPRSFISSLPHALRQAWSLVTRGVAEGLSANRIQTTLRQVGLGVRRQTLLDGIRLLKEGFASDKTLRLLPGNRIPPLRFVPQALSAIRREFSYTVKVSGYFQDKSVTRIITLSTNDRLTPDEAIAEVSEKLATDAFGYGAVMDVQEAELVGIRRKGSMGLL